MRFVRTALLTMLTTATLLTARPLVIAHRGASGYLPEHTLESAAYAHALGADYIEQDVVLSKDDVLVVIHDIHLDTTTDVATRFPGRARADGRFYAIDFTWAELVTLNVRERFNPQTGQAVFPDRFPTKGGAFRLCTFDEQVNLIAGLNHSTGRQTGIYVEFKEPAFHATEGKDLGRVLLAALTKHGYTRADQSVFVQCFDPAALRRLRTELKTELKLVQLTGGGPEYAALLTPEGLRDLATWAQGIGPSLGQVFAPNPAGAPQLTSLVRDAQAAGLVVHPYTFRRDALPKGVTEIGALLDLFIHQAKVDGLFIDQPDVGVQAVAKLPQSGSN